MFKKTLSMLTGVTALAVAAVSTGFYATTSQATGKTTLYVGTEAGYAPFEFLDDKGELTGFDIDLAKYACEKMQVTCVFKNQGFDSLIPAVKTKKLDFVIAGLNINEERKKIINYTDEYLPADGHAYVVLANKDYKDLSELKNVAYQNGSIEGKYIEQKTKSKAVGYETYDLAMLDLESNRIQAVLATMEVAANYLKDGKYKIYGSKFTDPMLGLGYAMVVNKANKDLLAKLNAAIQAAKADGTIEKLKAKYGMQ